MPSPGVARNTVIALATQMITAAFTALLTLFLVRKLGPGDFGVFSLALGITGLLMLPADFGIAQSAGRFIAEHRSDLPGLERIMGAATRLKVLTGGVVALALLVLADPVAAVYDEPALAWTLRGMALAMFAQSLLTLYLQGFISLGRLGMNLWIVGIESALEATASIALVLTAGGASAAAFGRAAGYAAGLLVAVVLVRRAFGRRAVSLSRVRGAPPIARYAGVMLIVNGAYSLFSEVDVLLIGALLSSTAVGQFSAPLRLTVLLHYPGLALSNAVSPRMARGRAGEEPDVETFRQALRLLIVVQFAIVTPMLVWATPIVDLVLGPEYAESASVLRAMTPFILLSGIGPLLAVSVNYLGAARRRVPVAIAAVIVNVAIDLALLREIGVVAAAIATSVAFVVYTGGHAVICHRLLDLHPTALARTTARSLLAAAAMAGVLVLFGTGEVAFAGLVAGSVCGLAVYAGVIVVSRELTAAELARMRALLRRSG